MSDAARRKERKRLKREKIKAQRRRAASGSPYKHVGRFGEIEACYINGEWQTAGFATLQIIRENPRGGFAMACFLIDLWCAGLKDAWGSLDLFQEDVNRNLDRARERFELVRIDPDQARRLVAGAIRFARQNGFRLPAHYDRWVNVLGDVPDPATADLRPFGKDGGLLWVGRMDDLRRRLIGCSFEDFLAKPHVRFVTDSELEDEWDDEDFDDEEFDDDGEEVDSEAVEFANKMQEKHIDKICAVVHRRCQEGTETPSPLLREAATAILSVAMLELAADAGDETLAQSIEAVKAMAEEDLPFDCPEELKSAIQQIYRLIPEGWAILKETPPVS